MPIVKMDTGQSADVHITISKPVHDLPTITAKTVRAVRSKKRLPMRGRARSKYRMLKEPLRTEKFGVGRRGKVGIKEESFNEEQFVQMMEGLLESTRQKNEAKALLQAGKVVVVKSKELAEGEMLKIYPDDRREIIRLDEQYNEVVVKRL